MLVSPFRFRPGYQSARADVVVISVPLKLSLGPGSHLLLPGAVAFLGASHNQASFFSNTLINWASSISARDNFGILPPPLAWLPQHHNQGLKPPRRPDPK
jgi:hypothetical protein